MWTRPQTICCCFTIKILDPVSGSTCSSEPTIWENYAWDVTVVSSVWLHYSFCRKSHSQAGLASLILLSTALQSPCQMYPRNRQREPFKREKIFHRPSRNGERGMLRLSVCMLTAPADPSTGSTVCVSSSFISKVQASHSKVWIYSMFGDPSTGSKQECVMHSISTAWYLQRRLHIV